MPEDTDPEKVEKETQAEESIPVITVTGGLVLPRMGVSNG